MKFLLILLFILIHYFNLGQSENEVCYINLFEIEQKPELVVLYDNLYDFLYPEPKQSLIKINNGTKVIFSCPGNNLSLGPTTVTATCKSDSIFEIDSIPIDLNEINCQEPPFNIARYTGRSCEMNGKEIEIGYDLNNNGEFVVQILICFNYIDQTPLYSYYNLTRLISDREHGIERPFFHQDNFYDLGNFYVSELYSRKKQRATINKIIGLPLNSKKYIKNKNDYFLARGHLTAKADFVYGYQQNATFHYVNAAPQWQTFNRYNWEQIESDVRKLAKNRNLTLKVYTGTYGVTTLPHEETGEDMPLYLYVDEETDRKGLPVPELYWKVVYDADNLQGIALLGINNPYQTDIEKSIICPDISEQIEWLAWNRTNIKLGYSYACDINELRKVITYLPSNIEVNSLLI